MAAARRWALFGISLLSLVVLTYAGVLLAFSVSVTPAMLEANSDLPEAGRAVVVPITDPGSVRTHAEDGEGVLLVSGRKDGSAFPAAAQDTSLARALAYVEAGNASSALVLTGVPSRNGTSDLTVDAAALSAGRSGWIVMGSGEETPRFFAREDVLGEVARFTSGSSLGLAFAGGGIGFVLPLVALIVTHKPSGRKGAPEAAACRECGGPLATSADFCMRCGAYRSGD